MFEYISFYDIIFSLELKLKLEGRVFLSPCSLKTVKTPRGEVSQHISGGSESFVDLGPLQGVQSY